MPIDASDPSPRVAQPDTRAAETAEYTGITRSAWFRWLTRASVAGVALSILVHLLAGVVAGLFTIHYPRADAGGVIEGAEVEFAVMTESELAAVLASEDTSTEPLVPESESAINPAAIELTEVTPTSADALTEDALDIQIDDGAGDVSDSDGEGLITGAGGGGASFFGLEAQGSRFAYIVDRSSSMKNSGKMARTRAELSRSITALAEHGEFLIVFYSDNPEALGGRPRWRDASERSKADARRLIGSVVPMGGTKPLPAFELIFGRRVKPDAIYFMTDGEFDDNVPDRIEAMNRRYRVPVHCILFGRPSPNAVRTNDVRDRMKRIADTSGGRFRHVETGP